MPSPDHDNDPSNGWEAISHEFLVVRSSSIGAATVKKWAEFLTPGQEVLDVGCGFGGSYTSKLINSGLRLYGVDASITLINEYRRRYPGAQAKCESAETSLFFEKKFDGVISVGLIFLLTEKVQIRVLHKMAAALNNGGRLLFSSPHQVCHWDDLSTGRTSISLGRERYISTLQAQGLNLVNEYTDEGGSHYYELRKPM